MEWGATELVMATEFGAWRRCGVGLRPRAVGWQVDEAMQKNRHIGGAHGGSGSGKDSVREAERSLHVINSV
jgi:hypothetical protein